MKQLQAQKHWIMRLELVWKIGSVMMQAIEDGERIGLYLTGGFSEIYLAAKHKVAINGRLYIDGEMKPESSFSPSTRLVNLFN